jgi:hypothetical protein
MQLAVGSSQRLHAGDNRFQYQLPNKSAARTRNRNMTFVMPTCDAYRQLGTVRKTA